MKRLLFLLPLSLVFVSCHDFFGERVKGNGNVITENRSAANFSSVHVRNNIKVHLNQGSDYSVKVETDQNLMEYIQIRVEGDVLDIDLRHNVNLSPSHDINVYVSAPVYKNLKASGACHFVSETKITSDQALTLDLSGASGADMDLKAPKLDVDLTGACTIDLKGETRELNIEGSGASEAKCFDLMAENVEVHFSGASNAEVFASVSLKAEASGASNVRYKGSPSVNQNSSGASSVSKVD